MSVSPFIERCGAEDMTMRTPTLHIRRRASAGLLASTLLAALLGLVAYAPPSQAAAFNVDNMNDVVDTSPGDGSCVDTDGLCSLRAAIMEANALGGSHTINVDKAPTDPAPIPLSIPDAGGSSDAHGDLDISADITLTVGPRPDADIIPGAGFDDRAITVHTGGSLNLAGINVRSFDSGQDGGAIYNEGALVLGCGVHITDNSGSTGGAIHNAGSLEIEGAAAISSNKAKLGGNLYVAPDSKAVHRANPACPATLDLGTGEAERGGSVYAATNSGIKFETDLSITGSLGYTSGGAFEVVDGASVEYLTGLLSIGSVAAPTGSVAHVADAATLYIWPGPPDHTINTRIDGAKVDAGGAHFHVESANLGLVEVEVYNSMGDALLAEGSSNVNIHRISVRAGEAGDDGIIVADSSYANIDTSYVDDRDTGIRVEDNAGLDLYYSTIADNIVGLDRAVGTTVNLDGVWMHRNTKNCASFAVSNLIDSAITDTSCGTDASTLTDPTVADNVRQYNVEPSPVWGPDEGSVLLEHVAAPCSNMRDLDYEDRPAGDAGCEPGAIEYTVLSTSGLTGTLLLDETLDPAPGMCVVVVDTTGNPVGGTIVNPDGTWTVTPLTPGDYRLGFYPCDQNGDYDPNSPYFPEMWQNHPIDPSNPDFTVGDLVTVVDASLTQVDGCVGTDPSGGDANCGLAVPPSTTTSPPTSTTLPSSTSTTAPPAPTTTPTTSTAPAAANNGAAPPPALAYTGVDWRLAFVGLLVLAIGGMTLVVARRRSAD